MRDYDNMYECLEIVEELPPIGYVTLYCYYEVKHEVHETYDTSEAVKVADLKHLVLNGNDLQFDAVTKQNVESEIEDYING